MKRILMLFLALFMALTMAMPATTLAAPTTEKVQVNKAAQLEVSKSLFSITEIREVELKVDFGKKVDLSKLSFQFGGKDLSEWKKWDSKSNSYSGDSFIKVIKEPYYVEGTTKIAAKLEFGLPYNTNDLSTRSIRVLYKKLIGDYELALVDSETSAKAATTVKLNVYDEYLDWEAIKPSIDSIFSKAKKLNKRYLEYQSPGKSVEGRDFNIVILAKDKKAVDKYLNQTLPTALENPEELIKKIKDGTMGDYQVPIWFNNIHPDEVEGIDFQTELLKKFALESKVKFNTSDDKNNPKEVVLDMDKVLDNIIFIFNFSHNPDGRANNTRANALGFDLNRDNAYQTQVETIQLNDEIAKWTPLTMVEGHGYVKGFLIEPATPPHNPNFEYDLLIKGMMAQAHAMGKAGVGNSSLDSYFVALEEYKDGWDDMGPSYTPIFSMLHGTLGHTVEVPSLSQDSLYAMVGTGLGATNYVLENKDELYLRQLEIFNRGVKGEDNRLVDPLLTNAAGKSIGRVRGNNENFFPDYFVLPTNAKNQKNVSEVYNMVNYLIRNGVKVEQTTKSVTIDGTIYLKGTYVVPMKQAKRGLANAMLYQGDDVSDWEAMYDPVVVNFPALRGFDIVELRLKDGVGFEGNTKKVSKVDIPKSEVPNTSKQVLKNVNNDTIKLVNKLLAAGKQVELVQENKYGFQKGDFVVNKKDILPFANTFVFEALPLQSDMNFKTKLLVEPKVAGIGSSQLTFSLKELGFQLVEEKDAKVVISDNKLPEKLAGKTFVGIGDSALKAVKEAKLLDGFDYSITKSGHEGLIKATINVDNPLNSGYEREELLYTTRGAWITKVPEGSEVLATVKNADDFYVAGWWPGHEKAKGQVMAFTKDLNDSTVILFANDLAFRAHTKNYYRMLANTIYASSNK
jgi:murein tripeptide amidase MpaA